MTKTNPKELFDLVLHPVRMRIVTLLSGSSGMTPQQIAGELRDVPQATLYRHVNRLARANLLAVVEERQVRGTVEKVYAVNTAFESQLGSPEDAVRAINQISKQDHLRYFTSFAMTLIGDFQDYLSTCPDDNLNLAADGVGYHKLALFLSDEEFQSFASDLNQALAPYLKLPPSEDRRKRLFTTILMPSSSPGLQDGPSSSETL